MFGIWLPIIIGVILVPMIATKTKEMEDDLANGRVEFGGRIKDAEDYKKRIKMLTDSVVGILVVIAIILAIIIGSNIVTN